MDRNPFTGDAFCSVKGQARKSLWIETMSAWRKCQLCIGQARKSLWIETLYFFQIILQHFGQARKSLWIETDGGKGQDDVLSRSGS